MVRVVVKTLKIDSNNKNVFKNRKTEEIINK